MDKSQFTKEMKIISKFKSSKENIRKRKYSKSMQLFKVLIQNGQKFLEALKETKMELDKEITAIDRKLDYSSKLFETELENYHTSFSKLKYKTDLSLTRSKYKDDHFSIIDYFNKIKAGKEESTNRKIERSFDDDFDILNVISNSNEYKLTNEVLKCCNNKLNRLNKIKTDFSGLTKNKKKRNEVELSEDEGSALTNKTLSKGLQSKEEGEHLLKLFISYFNKNKPTSSILIPHRKRIFVNYYLDDSKRTTKSFNLAHVKDLDEFKSVLEEVKYFIKTHRVTKE